MASFAHFLILYYWGGVTFLWIAGNVVPRSALHSVGLRACWGLVVWHLRRWWTSVLGGRTVQVPISFAHHTYLNAWMRDAVMHWSGPHFCQLPSLICRPVWADTWPLLLLPVALAHFSCSFVCLLKLWADSAACPPENERFEPEFRNIQKMADKGRVWLWWWKNLVNLFAPLPTN